jgi:hypothetical protein
LLDEVRHLLKVQRAWGDERDQLALAAVVLDERLAVRPDRRGCDGKHVVRLQRRVRDPADMPQLQEDQAAGPVDGAGDQAPALDLLLAVDARRPGVALPLHRHLRGFADDQRR